MAKQSIAAAKQSERERGERDGKINCLTVSQKGCIKSLCPVTRMWRQARAADSVGAFARSLGAEEQRTSATPLPSGECSRREALIDCPTIG